MSDERKRTYEPGGEPVPDIGVGDTLRFMRENMPPPSFPCMCDGPGKGKLTSVPCPKCIRPGVALQRPELQALLDEIQGRQQRAVEWVNSRLGAWSMDPVERARRFLEEAVELVQAAGCPVEDARRTVDFVFSRSTGDAAQEVGGARLTLLALAASLKIDALEAEAAELVRVYALPVERFKRRDEEKRAAGICAPISNLRTCPRCHDEPVVEGQELCADCAVWQQYGRPVESRAIDRVRYQAPHRLVTPPSTHRVHDPDVLVHACREHARG